MTRGNGGNCLRCLREVSGLKAFYTINDVVVCHFLKHFVQCYVVVVVVVVVIVQENGLMAQLIDPITFWRLPI